MHCRQLSILSLSACAALIELALLRIALTADLSTYRCCIWCRVAYDSQVIGVHVTLGALRGLAHADVALAIDLMEGDWSEAMSMSLGLVFVVALAMTIQE